MIANHHLSKGAEMGWSSTLSSRILVLALIWLVLWGALPAQADANKQPATASPPETVEVIYQGPGVNSGQYTVTLNDEEVILAIPGASVEIKQKIKLAQNGDRLSLRLDKSVTPWRIGKIEKISRPVSRGDRLMAMGATLLGLFFLALIFTNGRPCEFLIGKDRRYSNSQVQMVLWFGMTVTIYGATLALRYFKLDAGYLGGIGIPENVLVLSGLSAFSYGGAKMITAQKVINAEKASAAGVPPVPATGAPGAVGPSAGVAAGAVVASAASPGTPTIKESKEAPNIIRDLVQNDSGEYDLGDFQMLLVTLAAVIIFGLTGYHYLGTLDRKSTRLNSSHRLTSRMPSSA
jgi:hypothetical protein